MNTLWKKVRQEKIVPNAVIARSWQSKRASRLPCIQIRTVNPKPKELQAFSWGASKVGRVDQRMTPNLVTFIPIPTPPLFLYPRLVQVVASFGRTRRHCVNL